MSQISPPIRILVIAVLGLMAAWMLVLKPKEEPAAPPAAAPNVQSGDPAVSEPGKVAEAAKAAADATNAKTGATERADGSAGATAQAPGTAQAPATAQAAAGDRVLALAPLGEKETQELPAGVRKALERRQVLVIGVFDTVNKRWAPMAADDRRVRGELAKANRYGGNVAVTTTTVAKVNRFDPIIGDLDVSQTPTIVVVDRNRKATVLAGYVERNTINQAIADARRNTIERRIKEPYLRRLNETCANYTLRLDRFVLPSSRGAVKPAARRLSRLVASYRAAFGRLAAPARYKPLQAQITKVLGSQQRFVAALRTGNMSRAGQSLLAADAAAVVLDRRLDAAGVTSCVEHRRS